jgi:hypothetical protein
MFGGSFIFTHTQPMLTWDKFGHAPSAIGLWQFVQVFFLHIGIFPARRRDYMVLALRMGVPPARRGDIPPRSDSLCHVSVWT